MSAGHSLVGGASDVGWVALKAALLFLTAVVAFRVAKRRTIAEMAPFDFVAAVAAGAIVGRVPNAAPTSFLEGAVTLLTILSVHGILTRMRQHDPVARLVDHPPRLLAVEGHVLEAELRRAGLTRNDFDALMREAGLTDLSQLQLAIFEQRGNVSLVRRTGEGASLLSGITDHHAATSGTGAAWAQEPRKGTN